MSFDAENYFQDQNFIKFLKSFHVASKSSYGTQTEIKRFAVQAWTECQFSTKKKNLTEFDIKNVHSRLHYGYATPRIQQNKRVNNSITRPSKRPKIEFTPKLRRNLFSDTETSIASTESSDSAFSEAMNASNNESFSDWIIV